MRLSYGPSLHDAWFVTGEGWSFLRAITPCCVICDWRKLKLSTDRHSMMHGLWLAKVEAFLRAITPWCMVCDWRRLKLSTNHHSMMHGLWLAKVEAFYGPSLHDAWFVTGEDWGSLIIINIAIWVKWIKY